MESLKRKSSPESAAASSAKRAKPLETPLEPAIQQLARPLPELTRTNPTNPPAPSHIYEKLSEECTHVWKKFKSDAKAAVGSIDPSVLVEKIDHPSRDRFIVGSEVGITGRFTQHVAGPLNSILNAHVAERPNDEEGRLQFADFHAALPLDFCDNINEAKHRIGRTPLPDLVIGSQLGEINEFYNNGQLVIQCVGIVMTPWNQILYGAAAGGIRARSMIRPLGRITQLMNAGDLKYGFITTYRQTVFVRWRDKDNFEVSPVIPYDATGPSLRECFFYLTILLEGDGWEFKAQRERRTCCDGLLILPPLTHQERATEEVVNATAASPADSMAQKRRTILLLVAPDEPDARYAEIQLLELLKWNKDYGKSIWLASKDNDSAKYIFKYWPNEVEGMFIEEVLAYDRLGSTGVVPQLLYAGEVVMSGTAVQPILGSGKGWGILMTKVDGVSLTCDKIRKMKRREQDRFLECLKKTLVIVKKKGVILDDSRPENVIWDGKMVTLIDLEMWAEEIEGYMDISYEVLGVVRGTGLPGDDIRSSWSDTD